MISWITNRLRWMAMNKLRNRIDQPDVVIGGHADPYLLRWWLIPRNRWLNIYLHRFLRSDDDRALHDHPWANASILLDGQYLEHTIDAGGIHRRVLRIAGQPSGWCIRPSGKHAHRIEIPAGAQCWTLFITGPVYRAWGFHCPQAGWIPWQRFTSPDDPGQIGPGCAD